MKTSTLALTAISLLSLASAQPHRRRHVHEHQNAKKDSNVVMVVDTVYAISEAPEVLVVVDQNGNAISTATLAPTAPVVYSHSTLTTILPATSSSASNSTSSTPAASSSSTAIVASVIQAVQSVASVASSAAPATSSASSSTSSGSLGFGTAYSPYQPSGACKSQAQVNQDVAGFASHYSHIRIYGTSCGQVATVLQAAKSNGLKVIAGVTSISSPNAELQTIISAVGGDWSTIHTVAIGNEDVNVGTSSPSQVISAVQTARGILQGAGYTGYVVHVDTMAATLNYPELADASDYAAVNCHPYFDPNTNADGAGPFITGQIALLKAKLSSPKDIWVTETGWPKVGPAIGAAVPSVANQAAAISSIKSSLPLGVTVLSAYNDLWKSDPMESSWGVEGKAPSDS